MYEDYLSILIIVDSPEDRRAYRQMLLAGPKPRFRFHEAESGSIGLRFYSESKSNTFDCILLDESLRDSDACQLLRQMGGPDGLSSPVVVINRLTGEFNADPHMRLGAHEFIGKESISPNNLTQCIQNAMVRFKLELERRVSERTQDLDQTLAALKALWMNNNWLDFVLKNSRMGVWDMSLKDHSTHRSLLHDQIYGYSDLLPEWTYERFIEHVIPEDRARVDKIYREAAATKSDWKYDIRIRRQDGEIRWIHAAGGFFENLNDETDRDHVAGIVQDITERMLLIEQLKAAKESAEMANQAKSQFLANMSHEIRTPLNAILGLAQLLENEFVEPVKRERITNIKESGRHLLELLNNILDFSKIEASKLSLDRVDFTPRMLFDLIHNLVSDKTMKKCLALHVDLDYLPSQLYGDFTRLSQAMLNYIDNAIKFTDRGGIWVNADIIEETESDLLARFTVRDTGIGISPESLQKLFVAFEQGDLSSTRKFGGTGLGLAITRQLAQLMGGDAGAESKPSLGSTFWFTARLGKGADPNGSRQNQLRSTQTSNAKLIDRCQGARILLAEDNSLNQEVALGFLEQAGLVVDLAINGRQAVQMAQRTAYALILMDIQMPEMDGLDATRLIRILPQYRDTPILAMTAGAFQNDRIDCLNAGMNDHIPKPVDQELLYDKLWKWLDPNQIISLNDKSTSANNSPALLPNPQPIKAEMLYSAPPCQIPESPPVLDIEAGLKFWQTPDIYRMKLSQLALEYASYPGEITACLQSGNVRKAKQLAHELHGVAGILRLKELALTAKQLEGALSFEESSPIHVEASLSSLRQSFSRSLAAIDRYFTHSAPESSSADTDKP